MPPRKNETKTRGRPFAQGNPGRPRGARNRATLAAEAILEGEAQALSRKAVEQALAGDTQALKLCLDRLLPPRRERFLALKLPPIAGAADAGRVAAELIAAIACGELAISEATGLMRMVEAYSNVAVMGELEERVTKLEERRNEIA